MAGRPAGAQNKDKPFRDALRMEIATAGTDLKALRKVALALLAKAETGDVAAIREIADRLDGKVPTPLAHSGEINLTRATEIGDDELAAIATGRGEGTDQAPVDPTQLN